MPKLKPDEPTITLKTELTDSFDDGNDILMKSQTVKHFNHINCQQRGAYTAILFEPHNPS